ncbi:MAG: prepilin-type N-terminal cleavage/methylation domain-containing protein [Verrucomicrobiota bacterium]
MKNLLTHFRKHRGFSLVEVVLALAVFSFSLVSLMGLIPLGLNANSNNGARLQLAQTMSSMCDSLSNGPVDNEGLSIFPYPLSHEDFMVTLTPGSSESYGLLDDGTLCNNTRQEPNRIGTVRIEQGTPNSSNLLTNFPKIPVFISIAIPESAQWENGQWEKHKEYLETILYVPYKNISQ